MNPSHSAPVDGPASDSEVVRVLDAYLSGIEAGRPADPDKLLADHPALADRLRAYLQVMNLAGRLVEDSHARPDLRPPGLSTDGSSPSAGSSLLTTLDLGPGPPPHIQLRDLLDDREPLVMPRSAEIPDRDGAGAVPGRYQLQGEIARGGMGAILKGRDVDLGRDLAIKVLLESHRGNPEVVRRFVEEAQIGGQLQHPGVVPVYELGTFPDRRPYFAMKLVKGRTLAVSLHERTDPAQDLPRFLTIFEQVCQTVAYAHARGVIHRDLKPSNVMVGSFGEVQVMDWGLAKVLPQGGVADEAAAQPVPESAIVTVRSAPAGSGSESQAGSVLGTPSYMAPEQARGEVGRIDERADVFGLGAILCEILTGRPPFAGSTREEIRARAARGDLADALGRLDSSGVDGDLVDLARDCLAAHPERRPRSAGEVARRLTTYLAGVQERLKTAELARVEAQARAEEALATAVAAEARARAERRARRLTAALAASVLGLVVLGGGGAAYLARQSATRRAATERGVTAALAEARVWRDQARKAAATGALELWSTVLAAARHARDLADQGDADPALGARVEGELIALEREQEEAKAERRLLDKLETIRGRRAEHWNPKQTDAEYTTAFRESGSDIDRLDPKEAGAWLAKQTAMLELVPYLDDWAFVRREVRGTKDEASWRRLVEVARTADPNPWRDALRQQIIRGGLNALQRLAADEPALEAQPVASLVLLADALGHEGDRVRAESVLKGAWSREPSNFWVCFALALTSWSELPGGFDRPEQAARYLTAAVAIRPQSFVSHDNLGNAFGSMGRHDEAITAHRAALRLKPDHPSAHNNLGLALKRKGQLDEAITEFRAALRLKPDYADAHSNLGITLVGKGQLDEAINEFRAALRLKPDGVAARVNLASALAIQGQLDEAIVEFRAVLKLRPDLAETHNNLGLALRETGSLNEAVAALRKAGELVRGRSGPMADEVVRELKTTERQAAVIERLPAILGGIDRPKDDAERLTFGELCSARHHQLHAAAAGFYAEALSGTPRLADDRKDQHRYNAARAAALAGAGQGKDQPPLDESAKARWRKQAIAWLKAELAAWSKVLESGSPQARSSVALALQSWRAERDLAGLRDQAALAKLPDDEQKACRALWAEVDALLAKTGQKASP